MKRRNESSRFRDLYEYHGNTEVERVRKRDNRVVSRDWVIFDTVEEAMEYFNSQNADFLPGSPEMPAWMIHAAMAS